MKEQGVWALAWKRFRRDRLGSFSLIVVLAYVALVIAVAAGLASDWQDEAGVSFAPPAFLGPEADTPQLLQTAARGEVQDYGIPDPLSADLAEIAKGLSGTAANQTRAPTLLLCTPWPMAWTASMGFTRTAREAASPAAVTTPATTGWM